MRKELLKIKDQIVVVSKGRTLEQIQHRYDEGFRMFGENRVQELLSKVDKLPTDIHWHMIGHLQKNKVRPVVKYCDLIHSVDSLELLKEINKEAKKINKIQPVLIQINFAKEETKFGIEEHEFYPLLENAKGLDSIDIQGIMCIGPHTDDEESINQVFKHAHEFFEEAKSYSQENVHIQILSMGMSDDYPLALKNGSTLLRLGRILFQE